MPLYRHVAQGHYEGEVWSFGVHSQGSLLTTAANAAWVGAFQAFWTATGALYCATVGVDELTTAEVIQTTGKQATKAYTASSLAGSNAGPCLPFQIAPVVSFRTAAANRTGRGRIYTPSPAVDQIVGSKLVTAARQDLLDGAVDMLRALRTAGLTPVLYGRTDHQTQEILSVDVGDVVDTQRRRRNKLIEQRISEVL